METERKYLHPSFAALRTRLKELGASSEGAHFESNVVLDNSQLRSQGALLRVRTQEWPNHVRHVLTFKFPPPDAGVFIDQGIKAREELETVVADAAVLISILRHLGFGPVMRYEKVREEWAVPFGSAHCAVALDTVPFGEVAEVEAPPELQNALGRALGLDNCGISPKNYYELHRDITHSADPNILFSSEDRLALRESLHLPS